MAARSGTRAGTSFVIRLWLEKREGPGGPEWRFYVQHVQGGDHRYGRSMTDLLAFVERHAQARGPAITIATGDEAREVQR
jgi:hypothetical protein